ncbi:hypothetical protein F5Y13DRAFT_207138 [Hypoxylon sp. FL1857]|nr:hypothetical protein F5Y13DRAFT_207138 [Hypoxylon sp. FL1857]
MSLDSGTASFTLEQLREAWTRQIEQIETAAQYGFGDFEDAGLFDIPAYYLSLYGKLTDEDRKPEEALFKRGVGLLKNFYQYARDSKSVLAAHKDIHYKLWNRINDLATKPFGAFDLNIRRHVYRMTLLAMELEPPYSSFWKDGDLTDHKRFREEYQNFLNISDEYLYDDVERRNWVLETQRRVEKAIVALRLVTATIKSQVNWTDDTTRPTYVDYPCTSDEYLYGEGKRPGVLSLKLRLGGSVTPEEREKMNEAKAKKSPNKRPASESKEPEPEPKTKKPRHPTSYTMTMENVDADIDEIYNDATYQRSNPRPPRHLVVTPITTIREGTLQNYRTELGVMIRQCRNDYFRGDKVPGTQERKERMLISMDARIQSLRDYARGGGSRWHGFGPLKISKVTAYQVRLLRSLYMKVLLSLDPPASTERLKRALMDRLDDWILFEEIWNEGDHRSLHFPRLGPVLRAGLRENIEARDANIKKWATMLSRMRNTPGLEELKEESTEIKEESSEPEEPAEPEKEPEKEAEEPEKPAEPPKYPWMKSKPGDALNWCLEPRKPGKTVYVSWKIDTRQEERARARIADRNEGFLKDGEGPELKKLEARYAEEDAASDKVAAALAQKGPPEYEKIPRNTVFERLMYMIIIFHWRLFQTRSIL